ncbi:unnamed protein product, partial [Closterium sp. NIES-53]
MGGGYAIHALVLQALLEFALTPLLTPQMHTSSQLYVPSSQLYVPSSQLTAPFGSPELPPPPNPLTSHSQVPCSPSVSPPPHPPPPFPWQGRHEHRTLGDEPMANGLVEFEGAWRRATEEEPL